MHGVFDTKKEGKEGMGNSLPPLPLMYMPFANLLHSVRRSGL
jgi:hypothetical protein